MTAARVKIVRTVTRTKIDAHDLAPPPGRSNAVPIVDNANAPLVPAATCEPDALAGRGRDAG